jgi:DNA-binding transcriptional LysR family regulator
MEARKMLEVFRIFTDLVETHSFSRAATANFITQSAVSQRIRKLEDELGQRLLVRNRRLEPTKAGRILYAAAKEILARYEQSLAELRSLETVVAGHVRLAIVASVGLHRLPACIKEFFRRYPSVMLDVEYRTFTEIYAGLLDGSLDLGVVACPLRHPQTVVVPLRGDELVVIVPPGHPLARSTRGGTRAIEAARLGDVPFVAFDECAPTRRLLERHLQGLGVSLRVVQQLDNVETIKRAVEAGTGAAVVPRCTVMQEVKDHALVALTLAEGPIERPLGLVYRKGKVLDAPAARLVELLSRDL